MYLSVTVTSPSLEVGEIHETEIHRFFDLVGEWPGQQYPGDMGFEDLEMADRMIIQRGVLQRSQ